MKVRRYFAALAVPVLAGAGALAAAGVAHAAPLATYQDSSVAVVGHPLVDEISGITASYDGSATALDATPTVVTPKSGDHIQFAAQDFHGPVTWSITSGASPETGVALAIDSTTGVLTATITGSPASLTTPVSVTVKATDGHATGFGTVTAGPVNGQPSEIAVTATEDVVTLPVAATDNTTGSVNLLPVVAGITETLGNAPAGVVLSDGVIAATGTIPGAYKDLSVTGTDAAGSTAVETFGVNVVGGVVRPDVPRLSGGHAVYVAATREDVYFVQSGAASWDHFTIVGPGAINGHQGWVNAKLGLNAAVYSGLDSHQGYTVYYQPVEGQGSTVPVPGSHWGYVYFVS
jgi:hypothetical protein